LASPKRKDKASAATVKESAGSKSPGGMNDSQTAPVNNEPRISAKSGELDNTDENNALVD